MRIKLSRGTRCLLGTAIVGFLSSVVLAPASLGSTSAAAASDSVPTPSVEGPILPGSGISFLGSTLFPPTTVGYEQSEFFLSGNATAYSSSAPLAKDGRWHVTPETTAPYKTRIVVYRPTDPARFDGTVVVEWLNVTGGIDAPAAWLNAHDEMIREGMAFTVEPMVNAGSAAIRTDDDGWTVRTTDGALSAQFEHTVLIGARGPEITTVLD